VPNNLYSVVGVDLPTCKYIIF